MWSDRGTAHSENDTVGRLIGPLSEWNNPVRTRPRTGHPAGRTCTMYSTTDPPRYRSHTAHDMASNPDKQLRQRQCQYYQGVKVGRNWVPWPIKSSPCIPGPPNLLSSSSETFYTYTNHCAVYAHAQPVRIFCCIPSCAINFSTFPSFFSAPIICNKLPAPIRKNNTLDTLKCRLKMYITSLITHNSYL